jgi:GntR family transcriptional regulator/MocR family aminotransferase
VEPLSVRHLEQPARHGLAFGVGGIRLEHIGPALAALRGVLSSGRPRRPGDE